LQLATAASSSQASATVPPIGKLAAHDDYSQLPEFSGTVRNSFRRQAKQV
jgi:hypothetical protein